MKKYVCVQMSKKMKPIYRDFDTFLPFLKYTVKWHKIFFQWISSRKFFSIFFRWNQQWNFFQVVFVQNYWQKILPRWIPQPTLVSFLSLIHRCSKSHFRFCHFWWEQLVFRKSNCKTMGIVGNWGNKTNCASNCTMCKG